MRLLHHLADSGSVWPFDPLRPGGSAVVEIYCRVFICKGGARGLKLRTCADLNRALAGLGSASAEDQCYSDHQTDDLVAAGGMSAIAEHPRYWRTAGLRTEIARPPDWQSGADYTTNS